MDYFAFGAVYTENFLTSFKTGWSSSVDCALISSNSAVFWPVFCWNSSVKCLQNAVLIHSLLLFKHIRNFLFYLELFIWNSGFKITLHLFLLVSVWYVVVKLAFLKVKMICRCEHKFQSGNLGNKCRRCLFDAFICY